MGVQILHYWKVAVSYGAHGGSHVRLASGVWARQCGEKAYFRFYFAYQKVGNMSKRLSTPEPSSETLYVGDI